MPLPVIDPAKIFQTYDSVQIPARELNNIYAHIKNLKCGFISDTPGVVENEYRYLPSHSLSGQILHMFMVCDPITPISETNTNKNKKMMSDALSIDNQMFVFLKKILRVAQAIEIRMVVHCASFHPKLDFKGFLLRSLIQKHPLFQNSNYLGVYLNGNNNLDTFMALLMHLKNINTEKYFHESPYFLTKGGNGVFTKGIEYQLYPYFVGADILVSLVLQSLCMKYWSTAPYPGLEPGNLNRNALEMNWPPFLDTLKNQLSALQKSCMLIVGEVLQKNMDTSISELIINPNFDSKLLMLVSAFASASSSHKASPSGQFPHEVKPNFSNRSDNTSHTNTANSSSDDDDEDIVNNSKNTSKLELSDSDKESESDPGEIIDNFQKLNTSRGRELMIDGMIVFHKSPKSETGLRRASNESNVSEFPRGAPNKRRLSSRSSREVHF